MADLTYTLVIRDDGTATIRKVAAELRSVGDAGHRIGQRVSQGAKQAQEGLTQMDRVIQRLERTAAAFLGMWVLTKVLDVPRALIETAIEFNSKIETAKLGIASILMAQGEFTNSVGQSVQGYDKLIAAQRLSADIVRQLQLDNLRTIATFDQLVKAFQQTVAPALERGFNIDQVRQYTVAMVQAAGALGLNLDMLAEETRSMLRGAISPRQTLIATALGITNEDIRRFQGNADALFNFIMDRLRAFSIAGVESQKTWAGLLSNVKDMVKILIGAGFENIFKLAKREAQALMDAIVTINQETGEITLKPEILDSVRRLGVLFEMVYFTIKDIASVVAALRHPVDFLVEAWRSISISARSWSEALTIRGVKPEGLTPTWKPWEAPAGRPTGVPKEWADWYEKHISGKNIFQILASGLKEFNDYLAREGKYAIKDYADYYRRQLDIGTTFTPRQRELRQDEIEYLMAVASEIGHINSKLNERISADLKVRDINVELSQYSGKQLQAVIKTVAEYSRLKDVGEEVAGAFRKLLSVRLAIAAIEAREAPMRIAQQLAQQTDQYEEQKRLAIALERDAQTKLRLTGQLTSELKKQRDAQLEFTLAEIDRSKEIARLERQRDIIGLRQSYAQITGDIEGQVRAMEALTAVEVKLMMYQADRTKDLEKQADIWDKIEKTIELGAKQAEQLRITAPIEQRAPTYAAGLRLAEMTGNLAEYERISRLILDDEIAALKVKGESNRYLQDLIQYKERQYQIELAIQKVEMERYAPDKIAQLASRYAAMTGDIEAQDQASKELLASELRRLEVDARLNEEQKAILATMLKQIEASESVSRNLSKEREILTWRREAALLQGDYLKLKELELELLKKEEQQLIENNKHNQTAVEAIKTYYGLQASILAARQTMDIGQLIDLGRQKAVVDTQRQLVDSFENLLPNAINAAGDALGNFIQNLISGTMSAKDALSQFLDSLASSFSRLLIDILMLIVKMEVLKALGYETTGGTGGGINWGNLLGSLFGAIFGGGAKGAAHGGRIQADLTPIPHFAEGGVLKVTKPTLFVAGEGQETEWIVPESKIKKLEPQPSSVALTIVNVVDPRQLDMYLASARGQQAIVNAIGAQAGSVRRVLMSQ